MLVFREEKKVSMGLAVSGVVLYVIAFVILFISLILVGAAYAETAVDEYSELGAAIGATIAMGAAMFIAAIPGVIGLILLLILFKQWSEALRTNKLNTDILIDYLLSKTESTEEKTSLQHVKNTLFSLNTADWAYWLFLIFTLIGFFFGIFRGFWNFLAFIFFAVYLGSVTKFAKELLEAKKVAYKAVLNEPNVLLPEVKHRNPVLFIVLSIVTIGIYYLYIVIAVSKEINNFLDADFGYKNRILNAVQ